MENLVFKERISNMNNKFCKNSLAENVINSKLSLRKEKLDKFLASKRKIQNVNKEEKKYKINLEELEIPSNFEIDINKYYQNFDINLLENYFASDNENLQKYALYILRQYFSTDGLFDEHVKIAIEQISDKCIKHLCNFLTNKDKSIAFEACWILINLSFDDSFEKKIVADNDNLRSILYFTSSSKNDEQLLFHSLWLLRNITFTNVKPKQFFFENKICDLFEMIYEQYKVNEKIIVHLLYIIINITVSTGFPEFKEDCKKLIPIISTAAQICTNPYEIRLWTAAFYRLSAQKDIIKTMLLHEIPTKLFKYYFYLNGIQKITESEKEGIKGSILYTIGNLLSGDDVETEMMLRLGVIDFLNQVLREENLVILKIAIWCLCNIGGGSLGQVSQLLEKNTVFFVLEIGINIYEVITNKTYTNENSKKFFEVFREICYFISVVVAGTVFEKLFPILNFKNGIAIAFLCQGLDYYQKIEIIVCEIMGALAIITKNEKLEKYDELMDFSFIEVMERCGIKEKLEVLEANPNQRIVSYAEALYKVLENDEYGICLSDETMEKLMNGKDESNDSL